LVVALLALGVLPQPALAADDVHEKGTTTYELLPDRGVVRVTVALSITNRVPSRTVYVPCIQYEYFGPYVGWLPFETTCPQTTSYYINDTIVDIEVSGRVVNATADSGRVRHSVLEKYGNFKRLRLTFRNTFYGQTRKLRLTYEIPGGKPRSGALVRAGQAYAFFCVTGNGADEGSVAAVLPSRYMTSVWGDQLSRGQDGDKTIYRSGVLDDPFSFWACIEGVDESAYHKRTVTTADGRIVEIQGWPEDPTWTEAVSTDVRRFLPALEDLIGLRLPGRGKIVIREVTQQVLGDVYAGDFDPEQAFARVSENYDPVTVAHELAHAWFNDTLFEDRWLMEGYAEWAARVAADSVVDGCLRPGTYPGSGEPNLRDWRVAGPRATEEEVAVVAFQYQAACWIVSSAGQAIGADRMAQVLRALANREIAYVGSGAPEQTETGAASWRRWLDLIDERGYVPAGVAELDAAQRLLAEFGVAVDAAELAQRSAVRTRYHSLAWDAGAWELPFAVREPMADWRFDDARAALTVAEDVVDLSEEANIALPEADLARGPLREKFESARDMPALQAAQDFAESQLAATHEVAEAFAALREPLDLIEQLGLVGSDLESPADEARRALMSGDHATAAGNAGEVEAMLAAASGTGLLRLGASAGASVLVLGSVVLLVRRRRARGSQEVVPERQAAGDFHTTPLEAGEPISTPEEGPNTDPTQPLPSASGEEER
jgi:hypothetical protein